MNFPFVTIFDKIKFKQILKSMFRLSEEEIEGVSFSSTDLQVTDCYKSVLYPSQSFYGTNIDHWHKYDIEVDLSEHAKSRLIRIYCYIFYDPARFQILEGQELSTLKNILYFSRPNYFQLICQQESFIVDEVLIMNMIILKIMIS